MSGQPELNARQGSKLSELEMIGLQGWKLHTAASSNACQGRKLGMAAWRNLRSSRLGKVGHAVACLLSLAMWTEWGDTRRRKNAGVGGGAGGGVDGVRGGGCRFSVKG